MYHNEVIYGFNQQEKVEKSNRYGNETSEQPSTSSTHAPTIQTTALTKEDILTIAPEVIKALQPSQQHVNEPRNIPDWVVPDKGGATSQHIDCGGQEASKLNSPG